MAADRLTVVGRAVPRLDARDKVTGAARYVSDLALPGLTHAKVWRSPVPRARIIETLTERAAAAPGVLAVCAAADLPVKRLYFGPAYRDQPILAHEVIRYAGEPVVAVVADTERHAQAALALVDVRYEELPAATSAAQALAGNASLIHPEIERAGHFRDLSGLRPIPGTNVCQHYAYQRGDLARALEDADLVVEGVYRYPALSHHALEPHCVVARVDGDGLTVWATTQHPFPVRRELADVFDLPLAAVQVVVPLIGGAFGGKCYTKTEPLAAALAARVRRPVRLALSMEENARTITRHAVSVVIKTAVTRDGTLLARECDVVLDTGAYADIGPRVATKAGYRAPGPYRIPTLRIDAKCVYTNNVPAGAYRGYGVPQVTWAGESQMDVIAERLGLPFASAVVAAPDTSVTPYDWGTSASRSTTIMGLAVQEAARDAREQVLILAATLLDAEPSVLTIRDGAIAHGDRAMTVAEVISGHYGLVGGEVTGVGSFVPGKSAGSLGGATVFWESGMGAAEIDVDRETGAVTLLKYISAADVGQAINPRECAAQDEGAAMQGIGPALFEARVNDAGQLMNPGLIEYRVPAFTDLPPTLETVLIENADGPGPFGAKGVGESGTFCVAPAIGSAIAQATGVRLTELPMTPERVWRALRDAGQTDRRPLPPTLI